MRKTKLKLKQSVKNTFATIVLIIIGVITLNSIKIGVEIYTELANKCDQEKGYVCSYYDIKQYSLGKSL